MILSQFSKESTGTVLKLLEFLEKLCDQKNCTDPWNLTKKKQCLLINWNTQYKVLLFAESSPILIWTHLAKRFCFSCPKNLPFSVLMTVKINSWTVHSWILGFQSLKSWCLLIVPSFPFRATEGIIYYYSDFHFSHTSKKRNGPQERFKSFSSGE